jgi:hypothetical protein
MDKVQERHINVDACLSNMDQGGSKEDADAVSMTKVKLDHDTVAKELEEETKHAIEMAGHTFLKENMEGSKSSRIPEIVE